MSRKSGLGKGLGALIPSGDYKTAETPPEAGIAKIPVDAIRPNPHQPRTRFDPDALSELAASIREHGIIQPLLVTRGPGSDQFTLVAGERRLLAARQAGLKEIPAIVREVTELQRVELALIENIQRADLGPLETADAYHQLAEDFKMTHDDIALRVGKSRTAVTNTLRLLKLPEAARSALAEGRISEGHARVLLSLSSQPAQLAALDTILKNELNVRQAEELVRKMGGEKKPPAEPKTLPAELSALEERLRASLGTKVTLTHKKKKGGTLIIHYYSDEELDTLVQKLGSLE